jgi:uncharacterized damage-inducible protein DinB
MPATAATLRTHLEYSAWATGRLLEAAATLTPDELTRDFNTADKSVLGSLVHIFAADRVWLARIQGTPRVNFVDPEDHNLAFLASEWPVLGERWKEWAAGVTDESVTTEASYADLKGNPWTTPLWQIILHVVNHATHHRGQVSGFLRCMGHKPPALDLIAYYRAI